MYKQINSQAKKNKISFSFLFYQSAFSVFASDTSRSISLFHLEKFRSQISESRNWKRRSKYNLGKFTWTEALIRAENFEYLKQSFC